MRFVIMRLAIILIGLVALLAAAGCGDDTEQTAELTPEQVAAQHAAAGDCDPASCASAAAGACAKSEAPAATAQTASADGAVPDGKVYGAGVSSAATTPVSALLAEPAAYLGQTVRVQGPVVGVCKHRGCWIEVASDLEKQKIQLKVNDGEIVFPPEVMGRHAVVEGVFEGIPLDHEQACQYLEQEASCQGESFDRATVPAEGITFYRIKGTGAVVVPPASS